jgi:hypothetical protein
VTVVAKLASYTAVTISTTVSLIVTACLVTSVQVVQQTTLVALAAQTYTIPNAVAFSYLV